MHTGNSASEKSAAVTRRADWNDTCSLIVQAIRCTPLRICRGDGALQTKEDGDAIVSVGQPAAEVVAVHGVSGAAGHPRLSRLDRLFASRRHAASGHPGGAAGPD